VRRTVLALVLLAPLPARADGAFPDSMKVLLPPDHPEQILLGTNFGLVVSADAGAHWHLVCEEVIATAGEDITQYLLGPRGDVYGLAVNQVARSIDGGCSWRAAGGAWEDPFFTDVFPDPASPSRVFALALLRSPQGWSASSLFQSTDGGATFGPPLYQAGQGLLLTGVESAASAPATVYLTAYGAPGGTPSSLLVQTTDGGGSWQSSSLLATLGPGEPRLAAVDPTDPRTIYYRVLDPAGDRLAISHDGGQGARVALAVDGPLTAFLRRADGTLLVGTKLAGAFASRDGGETFEPWPGAPHLRALGERGGTLYAVADNTADGYAVGSSKDGGKTWTPLLRFQDLCGVSACSAAVRTTCQPAWERLVDLLGITGCTPPPDAATPPAPPARGCSCQTGGSPGGLSLLVGAVACAARFRRRRGGGAEVGAGASRGPAHPRRSRVVDPA
jgi:hypothetical protein